MLPQHQFVIYHLITILPPIFKKSPHHGFFIKSLHIEMTRGREIPLWKRHSAITYRFQENLSFSQIASRLNIN